MHILNVTSFLIRSNQYDYAKKFMPYLISSNAAIQNPNFSVLIQNMKIAIAKHDNDEKTVPVLDLLHDVGLGYGPTTSY